MGFTVYKNAAFEAAKIGQHAPQMDAAMNQVRASVIRNALESRLTGAFTESIGAGPVPGERGRGRSIQDRLVWADDPGALAIEYGSQHGDRHMPGKFIFGRAYASAG